jgi:tetratricopeptide (TPR) repeat protein
MAEKRLTKHQLKEDPLVTGAFRAQVYLQENREKIGWGVGILAVLVLAAIWFVNGRAEKGAAAEALLTRANLEFQSGQIPLALQDYRQLVEKYSGTRAGKEGLYYLANAYFQTADYGQAELYFEKFVKSSGANPIIAASGAAGLAACLEKKQKTKEALEQYLRAVKLSKDNSQTPDYLVGAIKTASALGDSVQARELLARLRKDFPIYRGHHNQALLYMGLNGIFDYPQ